MHFFIVHLLFSFEYLVEFYKERKIQERQIRKAPSRTSISCQKQGMHNLRGFSIESLPYFRLKFTGNQDLFEQEGSFQFRR